MNKLLLLVTLMISGCPSCKKEVTDANGLPPATQTGANTFSCLINGKVYIPGNTSLFNAPIQSDYIHFGGGYHFRLVGTYGHSTSITSIGIFTESLNLVEGESIKLSSDSSNTSGIAYAHRTIGLIVYHTQLPRYSGSLLITHLDTINQIVSGTFWFNVITFDSSNDTITVTNGRFDVHYTR